MDNKRFGWLYTVPFVLVGMAWLAYPHFLLPIFLGDRTGLNTLFIGMAFAGIVISLFVHARGLIQIKSDLYEQKVEHYKQHFETTLFQLLHLSKEIVRGLRYKSEHGGGHEQTGRDCIEAMREDFVKFALMSEDWGQSPSERYETFSLKHGRHELGRYFRNLYEIVKYVDEAKIENRNFYTNIVRAQLSSNELFMLFYSGLSRFDRETFLPLLCRYEFFEHLPATEDVLQSEAEQYGKAAFGKSLEWRDRFTRSLAGSD